MSNKTILPTLNTISVPKDSKWGTVKMSKIEGSYEYDLIKHLGENLGLTGVEIDELEPFLLKCVRGSVVNVYSPRIGYLANENEPQEGRNELVLNIGDAFFTIERELWETDFTVMARPVGSDSTALDIYYFPDNFDDGLKLGFWFEKRKLTPKELKLISSYDFILSLATDLTRKAKSFSNFDAKDYQGQTLTLKSVRQRTIETKTGDTFDVTEATVVNQDGVEGTLSLKGRAKQNAISLMGDSKEYEFTKATLTLGDAVEKNYNGSPYLAIPMFISQESSNILKACTFS